MPTSIVFASEKGGVGKTTSAVNLAMALAVGGYRVLLVDMDPQSSVRYSFGVRGQVARGTRELLTQPDLPLNQICFPSEDGQSLDYVFSNYESLAHEQDTLKKVAGPAVLKERLARDAQDYDFVILDAPASSGMMALNAITAADLVVLPLQCESLAVKSLKRFLLVFKQLQVQHNPNLRIAGVLLTMYDRNLDVHRRICRQLYETLYDSVFSTIIPKAREITEASALGQSVITYRVNSVAATAYIRLAKELLDRFDLRPELAAS